MLGYVSSFFRSLCYSKKSTVVEEKNFRGVRLIITNTHSCNATSRCKVTFFQPGKEAKNYLIAGNGNQPDSVITEDKERIQHFNQRYEDTKNERYGRANPVTTVTLYNPDVSPKEFEQFIKKLKAVRFDYFWNNCSGTVQKAIHHLIKDRRVSSLYRLWKYAYPLYVIIQLISFLSNETPTTSGTLSPTALFILKHWYIAAAQFLSTACLTGGLPMLTPAPTTLPHDLIWEGRLYTLFGYNRSFAYVSDDSETADDVELGTAADVPHAQKLQHG